MCLLNKIARVFTRVMVNFADIFGSHLNLDIIRPFNKYSKKKYIIIVSLYSSKETPAY